MKNLLKIYFMLMVVSVTTVSIAGCSSNKTDVQTYQKEDKDAGAEDASKGTSVGNPPFLKSPSTK